MRCSVKRDVKDVHMYTVYCVYLYKCILHTIQYTLDCTIVKHYYTTITLTITFFFTKYELSTDKPGCIYLMYSLAPKLEQKYWPVGNNCDGRWHM